MHCPGCYKITIEIIDKLFFFRSVFLVVKAFFWDLGFKRLFGSMFLIIVLSHTFQ